MAFGAMGPDIGADTGRAAYHAFVDQTPDRLPAATKKRVRRVADKNSGLPCRCRRRFPSLISVTSGFSE